MAAITRPKPTPVVINALQANGIDYDFYQLFTILEKIYGSSLQNAINCTASSCLSFPSRDLRTVQFANDRWQLQCAFMGLYGVDAAMPHYFLCETVATEPNHPLKAFLDIFQQRLYTLLYLAWKKNRPLIQIWHQDYRFLKILKAVSGNCLTLDNSSEFCYANLWGKRLKSAINLLGLLRAYLPSYKISLNCQVPKWLTIDSPVLLGKTRLSDNCLLGEALLDATGKIHIHISGLHTEQLLPKQPQHAKLQRLLATFLSAAIDYTLIIKVLPPTQANRLGIADYDLGSHTWLDSSTQAALLFYTRPL